MLQSARPGAGRASSLAVLAAAQWQQALPAESSRQAQVRAVAPSTATRSRRSYAAAAITAKPAALNKQPLGESLDVEAYLSEFLLPDGASPGSGDKHDFTPDERFRRLSRSDPIGGLRYLSRLSPDELSTVGDTYIQSLLSTIKGPGAHPMRPTEATRTLRVVQSLLPSPTGRGLEGSTLRKLLRAGVILGASTFVKQVFAERMEEQVRTGRRIVLTDALVADLRSRRAWNLAVALFPGPSAALPRDIFTPQVVEGLMMANIALQRPHIAGNLFELLSPGHASPETLCALVQATLQMGDLPRAQNAIQLATAAGTDISAIQLVILNGYRTLGYNADLEQRMRFDIQRLGMSLSAPVLNAFMRLRYDARDTDGAKAILREFNVFGSGSGVEADGETLLIAIKIAAVQPDSEAALQDISELWSVIASNEELVTDGAISSLLRALTRAGCVQLAMDLFRAVAQHTTTAFFIPETYVPGIAAANTMLELAMREWNYNGLADMAAIMRGAQIAPDSQTLTLVLEFARKHLVSAPENLAKLHQQLLSETDTPGATADQLNVIIKEAVRVAVRDPKIARNWFEQPKSQPLDRTGPVAGIQLTGRLRDILADSLNTLEASGALGGPKALESRLLYDSLGLDGIVTVTTMQKTWEAYRVAGFRPGPKDYLALVRAYAKAGAMKEAQEVLELAKSDGCRPTTSMYVAVMRGLAKAGDLEGARTTYENVRASGMNDASALQCITYAHIMAKDPHTAVRIAKRDYASVNLDEVAIVTIAHALRGAGDVAGSIFFVAYHTARTADLTGHENVEDDTIAETSDGSNSESRPQAVSRPQGSPTYVLTPRLLDLVKKALNYLHKLPFSKFDQRMREAVFLGRRMLADDSKTRPQPRRVPSLTKNNRNILVGQFASAAEKEADSTTESSEAIDVRSKGQR